MKLFLTQLQEAVILISLALTAFDCSFIAGMSCSKQLLAIQRGGCTPLPLLSCPLFTLHWVCFLSISLQTHGALTHQPIRKLSQKSGETSVGFRLNHIMEGPMCARGSGERKRLSRIPYGSSKLLNYFSCHSCLLV